MKNISMQVKGSKLTIEIDLNNVQGKSKSGKSDLIATTGRPVEVDGQPGIRLGLNVFKLKRE